MDIWFEGYRILHVFRWQGATLDEFNHEAAQHEAFMVSRQEQFVGRKTLLKQCMENLGEMKSGLLVLAGKPGTGKSALMVSDNVILYVLSKRSWPPPSISNHPPCRPVWCMNTWNPHTVTLACKCWSTSSVQLQAQPILQQPCAGCAMKWAPALPWVWMFHRSTSEWSLGASLWNSVAICLRMQLVICLLILGLPSHIPCIHLYVLPCTHQNALMGSKRSTCCSVLPNRNLVPRLQEMLAAAGRQCGSPLILFLDGLDQLDDAHQARLLQWLPEDIPEVELQYSIGLDLMHSNTVCCSCLSLLCSECYPGGEHPGQHREPPGSGASQTHPSGNRGSGHVGKSWGGQKNTGGSQKAVRWVTI